MDVVHMYKYYYYYIDQNNNGPMPKCTEVQKEHQCISTQCSSAMQQRESIDKQEDR